MMTVSFFSPGWVKCVVYKFAPHLFSGFGNFLYPSNAHFLVGLRYSIVCVHGWLDSSFINRNSTAEKKKCNMSTNSLDVELQSASGKKMRLGK